MCILKSFYKETPKASLLLLLSSFSRIWLCATPKMAAHQAPHPWDSPGKNTGVGYHFLLQCMKVKSESEVAQSYLTPSDPTDCSLPGPSIHGIFQARVGTFTNHTLSPSENQRRGNMLELILWELTIGKRPCCREKLKAGGEGDGRGSDVWVASPTGRTWVWASSGS